MIKVRSVVELARNSSLRNLPIRDDDNLLVMFFNEALSEVYRRFNLSIKSTVVPLSKYKQAYVLDEPDVNMLLGIYKSNGEPILESDVIDNDNVHYKLINFKTFTINNLEDKEVICVYAASPEDATIDSSVDIPRAFQSTILMYMGYLAHMTINIDNMAESDAYRTRYENTVYSLISDGFKVDLNNASYSVQYKGMI